MIFDHVLALTLVWLAWRLLSTPDLFKAVVLFITFGLLLVLAWVRLSAPDIALAEAAIGAGLTGALLLDARARLESQDDVTDVGPARGPHDPPPDPVDRGQRCAGGPGPR